MGNYCINCKYFEDYEIAVPYCNFKAYCNAPQNKQIIFEETYRNKTKHIQYKLSPEDINVNNNCNYYKRIWWKFWVKEK